MIKFIKWSLILIGLLVVLLGIAILAREPIAIRLTQERIAKMTGFTVEIGSMNIPLDGRHASVRNVVLYNPAGFCETRLAIKINHLEGTYDLMSILEGKPHFQKLVVDIDEIHMVKNRQGQLNLDRLRQATGTGSSKFQIDELELSVDRALYTDEKRDVTHPTVYKIQAHKKIYQNLSSSEDIKKIVLNLLVDSLPENLLGFGSLPLNDAIRSVGDMIKQGPKVLDLFKSSPPPEEGAR